MYKRTNITKTRDFFKKAVTNIRRITLTKQTKKRKGRGVYKEEKGLGFYFLNVVVFFFLFFF